MGLERTEQQSDSQQRLASELSLQRSRPPAEVQGYEFEKFLGSGAYGEVWVALDRNTGRKVAVKFYTHRGGLDWRLLSREVEKLVLLSADRYIVQVLDVGWDATPPYYVMEFIENGSLDEYLKSRETFSVEEAVDMFRGVATGLLHAHNKGVLHCDVKPANVLLDQDHRPRLADFGQSRLSHEQTPALGTMFYMAPEQADMKAMPDARWDVYALGVLLYLMLTDELPHRDEETTAKINSATGLEDRLAFYRNTIRNAPAPMRHRKSPGVDRALADIVDRALAPHPKNRFPNVQAVLDALDARERRRARLPLITLGILGPAILLSVMALFGWRGYARAMGHSDEAVMQKARDGNLFAAQFVSSSVAHELERYHRAVELLASNERFVELFHSTVSDPELKPMLARLRDYDMTNINTAELDPEDRAKLAGLLEMQEEFEFHPARTKLQSVIAKLFHDERKPAVASWITTDTHGTHIATAFSDPPARSPIGRNFAWRSYFNGYAQDKPQGWHPSPGEQLKHTHLSAVFQSNATNTWKVAISTPILRDGKFLGIVALTVEMGGFLGEFENTETRYAVLVDGRVGPLQGVILQHPLFDEILEDSDKLPERFSDYRVGLHGSKALEVELQSHYRDPLSQDDTGKMFDRPWIMAKVPVRLRRGPKSETTGQPTISSTGWVVLVQEDRLAALEPVHDLGQRLVREGLRALAAVAVTIAALWYFVVRGMGDYSTLSARRAPTFSEITPRTDKTTLATRGKQ